MKIRKASDIYLDRKIEIYIRRINNFTNLFLKYFHFVTRIVVYKIQILIHFYTYLISIFANLKFSNLNLLSKYLISFIYYISGLLKYLLNIS